MPQSRMPMTTAQIERMLYVKVIDSPDDRTSRRREVSPPPLAAVAPDPPIEKPPAPPKPQPPAPPLRPPESVRR